MGRDAEPVTKTVKDLAWGRGDGRGRQITSADDPASLGEQRKRKDRRKEKVFLHENLTRNRRGVASYFRLAAAAANSAL